VSYFAEPLGAVVIDFTVDADLSGSVLEGSWSAQAGAVGCGGGELLGVIGFLPRSGSPLQGAAVVSTLPSTRRPQRPFIVPLSARLQTSGSAAGTPALAAELPGTALWRPAVLPRRASRTWSSNGCEWSQRYVAQGRLGAVGVRMSWRHLLGVAQVRAP